MAKEQTYFIKGMHCAACEVLVEKKLLEIPGVQAVDASTVQGRATVEYDGEKPGLAMLNELFKADNYSFSENPAPSTVSAIPQNAVIFGLAIAGGIVILFLLLDRLGLPGFFTITSTSSAISFFGFGILAGLSSCAALVGGIVLSLSKQWNALYATTDSSFKKFEPHLLFNVGRILSYGIFGAVLGLIGSRLGLSFTMAAWLVIIVSVFMIGLGLQMVGVPAFQKFRIALPKSITRNIANEKKFHGKYMPFIMGALTFFLPCGFTITAQTVALLSANPVQGALILGFFALGTAPMLLLIGVSSVKLFSKAHWAETFSVTAGFLVLFFAAYNIWNQLGILFIK